MGLKAFQILDFNNPVSRFYHSKSIESFIPVRDVIEIEPVQCITPETLPDNNYFGNPQERSVYELACYASHFSLIEKLQSETFFIMEHDAFLFPDRIEILYMFLESYKKFDLFFPGIACEFYTAAPHMAKLFCDRVKERKVTGGPLNTFYTVSINYNKSGNIGSTLWPYAELNNMVCISPSAWHGHRGVGAKFPSPITQVFDLSKGSTMPSKQTTFKVTKESLPNMRFL